jgi:hypothetical protein
MPASLQKVGAPVKAGQVIGLVGNTGNSSEPHTHVEAELNSSSSPLRPLPFHDAYALSENAFHPPDPQGPWSKLTGRGLSKEKVAVWPRSNAAGLVSARMERGHAVRCSRNVVPDDFQPGDFLGLSPRLARRLRGPGENLL